MERKTVGKPSSCTVRKCSSGAPNGLITTPRANGFTGAATATRGNPWATTAEAARPTKCLRFIQITIASAGPSCKIGPVRCKGMDLRRRKAHPQSIPLDGCTIISAGSGEPDDKTHQPVCIHIFTGNRSCACDRQRMPFHHLHYISALWRCSLGMVGIDCQRSLEVGKTNLLLSAS